MTAEAALRYAEVARRFSARARYLGAIIEPTPIYLACTLNEPPPWADVAIVTVDSRKLRRIVARWAREQGFTCTGPFRYARQRAYHWRHGTPWYSHAAPANPINEISADGTRTRVLTRLYINAPR